MSDNQESTPSFDEKEKLARSILSSVRGIEIGDFEAQDSQYARELKMIRMGIDAGEWKATRKPLPAPTPMGGDWLDQAFFVHVIEDWRNHWRHQTKISKEDFDNYRERASGIDANMIYNLADRLVHCVRGLTLAPESEDTNG